MQAAHLSREARVPSIKGETIACDFGPPYCWNKFELNEQPAPPEDAASRLRRNRGCLAKTHGSGRAVGAESLSTVAVTRHS
jgi:hypothetical protein